jgi:hypothetical protein
LRSSDSPASVSGSPRSSPLVRAFTFTDYFAREVLRKRPYLRKEWCVRVVENPLRTEPQEGGNRWRLRGEIPELDGRYLRVVTREDKVTVHSAFPDRRFQP